MSSLRELQTKFLKDVLNPADSKSADYILEKGLNGDRRLLIYHNNIYGNLRWVLHSIYPVVEKLVGKDFFNYIANRYIPQHPSTSGDLNLYGGEFANFLAEFPSVSKLIYLPDTARLEWLVHQVYFSVDSPPLTLDRLAVVTADHYANLKFILHPACRLFSSLYPIHSIWHMNQPGFNEDQTVDISKGGVNLLVTRQKQKVTLQEITCEEFSLLTLIDQNVGFSDICQYVLENTPDFDIETFLREFVDRCVITDFFLDQSQA